MKRIGPRQLPCGTPEERSNGLDVDQSKRENNVGYYINSYRQ